MKLSIKYVFLGPANRGRRATMGRWQPWLEGKKQIHMHDMETLPSIATATTGTRNCNRFRSRLETLFVRSLLDGTSAESRF